MPRALIAFLLVAILIPGAVFASDPLPSWRDGASRDAVIAFVERVTTPGPDFVEPDDRIAVFDNDGTLWAEKPLYFPRR